MAVSTTCPTTNELYIYQIVFDTKDVLISVASDNEYWFGEIEGWSWLES